MTRREQILAVLNRAQVPRPPVSLRLDLWYADAVSSGTLPDCLQGLSVEEVQDYLGFCRAARYRIHPRIAFESVEIRSFKAGAEQIEEYLFPLSTLVRKTYHDDTMKRRGMEGHITKYPVESESDLELLLSHLEEARLEFDLAGFSAFDTATGDAGLPFCIAGYSPMHLVMLQFTGYENSYYLLKDCPDKLEHVLTQLEGLYRRDLWPALQDCSATIVLYGAHFSSQMTPLPLFERYFLPGFQEFNALMHGVGKRVFFHADAEMGALLDHALAAGFDGADCLATTPLVAQRMEDYFEAWQGRITCWGGLPSIIFDPSFPLRDYERYVEDLVELTGGRNDFIFGASDNVMPGAEWERLTMLAEITGTWGS